MNKMLSAAIEEIKIEAAKPAEEIQLSRLRMMLEFALKAQDIDIDTSVSCYVDSPRAQLPRLAAPGAGYGPPAAERLANDLTASFERLTAPKPETIDSLIIAYKTFPPEDPLAIRIKKLIEIKLKDLEVKYENLHPELPGGRSAAE